MCTTLYVRTPLHGACVGIMFHTWVKNVFGIVDFFMQGFKRVPLPLYIYPYPFGLKSYPLICTVNSVAIGSFPANGGSHGSKGNRLCT